ALEDLIKNLNSTYVVFSYNDEGIISYEDLFELLKKYSVNNKIDTISIPYRKYKSKIASKKTELNEYILLIQKREIESINEKKYDKKKATIWTPDSKKYLKSPLNYIGGKYKLLNQIIPLFPKDISTFVDLFSGGANVGINVDAQKHVFIDMNTKINEMFRFFSGEDPVNLVHKIEDRLEEFKLSRSNAQGYNKFREQYNLNPNPL